MLSARERLPDLSDVHHTGEFLPQHRAQRSEVHQIINAAQTRGHSRLVEMNQQVADNLETIITALEADTDEPQEAADAH